MRYTYSHLASIVSILAGCLLVMWGLTYFIKPLVFIIVGLWCVNYGLSLSNLPTGAVFIRHILFRSRY